MEGMALLYYIALSPFNAFPVQMVNGYPVTMPITQMPAGTIIVADPSIVVDGTILPNRIISYASGQGGAQVLQVAETSTPISVGDGDV